MEIKEYKDRVARLGCIICGSPAQLHHPRFAAGMGQRASDWLVIPLCDRHHMHGGYGQAIHMGQATFEKNYGSEPKLLAQTVERMMSKCTTT